MQRDIGRGADEIMTTEDITTEEVLIIMKNFFENIDKEMKALYQELSEKDLMQEDLLHYIEKNNLRAGKLSKTAKAIKTVRQERRKIKNNIEYIKAIKAFTDKYNNRFIVGDILKTIKNLRMIKSKHQNYKYIYKVLKELEETNENFSNRSR